MTALLVVSDEDLSRPQRLGSLDSVVMRLGWRLLTLGSLVTTEALGLNIQQVSGETE